MSTLLSPFPTKAPEALPFVVGPEGSNSTASRARGDRAGDTDAFLHARHHALQLKCWQALEAFARRVAHGDGRTLDEPGLLAALDDHLTAALCGSAPRVWWHPVVVKADAHTLKPGVAHKAEAGCVAQELLVLDVGIVLDGLEIDCGLSIGFTPEAAWLAHAARELTEELIGYLQDTTRRGDACSPALAFAHLQRRAEARGLTQVAASAGHRTGPYPTPKRDTKIRIDDAAPSFVPGPWMVEVHVADASNRWAAFHEDCFYVL